MSTIDFMGTSVSKDEQWKCGGGCLNPFPSSFQFALVSNIYLFAFKVGYVLLLCLVELWILVREISSLMCLVIGSQIGTGKLIVILSLHV
jgi:hypothetical protein